MNELQYQLFIQTISYFVSMMIGLIIIGLLLKGFLIPYVKVRLSFGKYILAKIRSINREYFRVAWVEEGFLVFNTTSKDNQKRIAIKDNNVFYPCLATTWVDVDEESNALMTKDFSVVSGFDAEKYNNLFKRALYRPSINENREKLLVGLLLLVILGIIIVAFMAYKNGYGINFLTEKINSIQQSPTITGG